MCSVLLRYHSELGATAQAYTASYEPRQAGGSYGNSSGSVVLFAGSVYSRDHAL